MRMLCSQEYSRMGKKSKSKCYIEERHIVYKENRKKVSVASVQRKRHWWEDFKVWGKAFNRIFRKLCYHLLRYVETCVMGRLLMPMIIGCYKHLVEGQFSSVQSLSRVWLCDPMNRSTPGLPVHHQLPESLRLTSIESVMPSSHLILCRPLLLLPPIPPSISLFQWVNSSHEVAKVLEFQLQHHSFQRNPRADLLQNGLVGSPCSPRVSQESSPTPQFKRINSSALSLLHSPTLTSIQDHRKNHSLD